MSRNWNFYETAAGAGNSRAMESETIQKNGVSPKSQRSRISKFLVIAMVIAVGFTACKKEKDNDNGNGNYTGGAVYVIDNETITTKLQSISEDGTLIFSSLPSKNTPKENDIICCSPAGNAPRGFLYRVKNITTTDGKTVIQTKEVSLEETLEYADVKETINLDDHIIGVFDENGNPLEYKSGTKGTNDNKISIAIKREFELGEGKKITIEGSFTGSNKLEFEMNIDGWNLQYMKFAYTGETELKAEISGEIEGKMPLWNITIATIKLAPITIMAGVVPIVITPEIPIILTGELKGKVKGSFTLFDNKHSVTAGVKYENKEVKGIFETNSSSNTSLLDRLKVSVSGELKAAVEPGVSFLLYNSSGISVGATLSIYGKAAITLLDDKASQILEDLTNDRRYDINPELTIKTGVEANVKGQLKIFSLKVLDYKNTVKIFETERLRGSVFPQFEDISFYNITDNSATATTTVKTPANFNFIFPVSQHGICLSQNDLPTLTNSVYYNTLDELPATWTPSNVPIVSADITNLQPNQAYHACTYFTNIFGTFYGKVASLNSDDEELTITAPVYGATYHCGEWVDIFVSGYTGADWRENLKVQVWCLDGEPQPSNPNEPYSYTGYTYDRKEDDYSFTFSPETPSVWDGHWAKLVAMDIKNNRQSAPQYIRIEPINYEESVVINGVRWSGRNVDKPGTFTKNPEDAGMFYQWNRKIGWSSTDPMINSDGGTTWDDSTPGGDTWEPANNPCPAGWRVPTEAELRSLTDETKVTREWTTHNGVNGYRCTDKASGNTLFLPTAGFRDHYSGSLNAPGNGYYWSSSPDSAYSSYFLILVGSNFGMGTGGRTFGYSVRCVAE